MKKDNTVQVTSINGLPVDPKKSLVPVKFAGDRVLVEPQEPEKILGEGWNGEKIMKNTAVSKEPYMLGKIIAIGSGEYGCEIPSYLEAGQIVYYHHQGKTPFFVDKKEYDMVRITDIFALP